MDGNVRSLKMEQRHNWLEVTLFMQIVTFNEALDVISSLSIEDQEALITIIQKRFIDHRRAEIAANIAEAKTEYQVGQVF